MVSTVLLDSMDGFAKWSFFKQWFFFKDSEDEDKQTTLGVSEYFSVLPVELMELIISFLDDESFISFCSSCRSLRQFYTNYGATIWKQRSLQRWSLETLTKAPRYGHLCSHSSTSFVLDSPFNTTHIETLTAAQCQSYYSTRRRVERGVCLELRSVDCQCDLCAKVDRVWFYHCQDTFVRVQTNFEAAYQSFIMAGHSGSLELTECWIADCVVALDWHSESNPRFFLNGRELQAKTAMGLFELYRFSVRSLRIQILCYLK